LIELGGCYRIVRLFLMMKKFNLDFHGTRFAVPKGHLINLFEHHRDLIDATSYEVESSVPLDIFEVFVNSLETGTKVTVTKENAGAISVLAKEFYLDELLSECSSLQIASVPELIATLSDRITKLELQISSQPLAIVAELKESITNHERQLESLDFRISGLEPNLRTELRELKSRSPAPVSTPTPIASISPSPAPHPIPPVRISTPTPVARVPPSKSLKDLEFPFTKGWFSSTDPFQGIISYLTRKHGGNVHDKGIVTVTSKSVSHAEPENTVRNVVDFTCDSKFWSKNEPGQWICCDFQEMRVRPTHYSARAYGLRSWVVECSLDGVNWTEIDRQSDSSILKGSGLVATFAVSNSTECRFIRLTQTGISHTQSNYLVIQGLEFFGTLLE
jgi:uncharacterized coiled-coil protein SlyX